MFKFMLPENLYDTALSGDNAPVSPRFVESEFGEKPGALGVGREELAKAANSLPPRKVAEEMEGIDDGGLLRYSGGAEGSRFDG